MTNRRRHAYLIAASTAIAIAATVALALPDPKPPRPERAADGAVRTAQSYGPATEASVGPPEGTEPPNPVSGTEQRARAHRIGRRFLRAFLRYQAGHLDNGVRQELRATTTPPLGRALLRHPPRLISPALDRGKLESLSVVGPFDGQLKLVARLAYPALGSSLLELRLAQHGDALRVSRIHP